ncbi:MAG: mechanosensitive ion channel [Planctomycetota bacterium]
MSPRACLCLALLVCPAVVRAQSADVAPVESKSEAGDAALGAEIQATFARIPEFQGLKVRAGDGVVTLEGELEGATQRERAVALAERFPGVLYVNDLTTLRQRAAVATAEPTSADERIEARLAGVFERVAPLRRVQVDVEGGVVSLSGVALSEEDEARAVALAEQSEGVLYVHDGIEISRDIGERLTPSMERFFGAGRELIADLPLYGVALVVFALFAAVAWWIGGWSLALGPLVRQRLVRDVVRRVLQTAVLLGGVFAALEVVGATALVGAVLGAAGVVGLALGFAFRDIVENYLASVLLSVRRPFAADDLIMVNGEFSGTVVSLTTSDTILMTPDGNHLRLPNALVFKGTLINYTRNPKRRFEFPVGIGTEDDLEEAQRLALEVLNRMPGVLDDPAPFARVEELAESTVTVCFFGWVDQRHADFTKVKSQAIRLIKERFDHAGITMPAPTYRVEMPQPGEAKSPARPEAPPAPEDVDVSVQDDLGDQVRAERAKEGKDLLQEQAAKQPEDELAPV